MSIALLSLAALRMSSQPSAQDSGSGAGSSALFGPRGVSAEAVRQGTLGSCYFHSSIASLARSAPETLRSAITPIASGGYRVHFFEGPDEDVSPDDVEYGRKHGFDHSEGDWVLVLMRGYAQRALRKSLASAIQKSDVIPIYVKPVALQWLGQSDALLVAYDRAIRMVVSQDGTIDQASFKPALSKQLSALGVPSPEADAMAGFLDEQGFFAQLAATVQQNGEVFGAYKSLGQGGIPVQVFQAFTGKGVSALLADKEMIMRDLRRLHREGLAMVAGTWNQAPSADFTSSNWWVGAHSYSVLNFDEASQTLSMRNPWGGHPDPDGLFTIPLATFLQGFEFYSYAGAPAN